MITLEVNYKESSMELEFPCRDIFLQQVLEKLQAPKTLPPKLYVAKVLNPGGLSRLGGQVLNLDEINYLAKRMENLSADEYAKLYALSEYKGYTAPKDVINATFNLDNYTQQRAERELLSVGKKQHRALKGVITEYGQLYQNPETEFREVYDGQVFPRYRYKKNYFLEVEIGYGGKKEYVYLPDEPLSITKALSRLGAPTPKVCSYALTDFEGTDQAWKNKFERLLERESIFDINRLSENLSSGVESLEKLSAVLEYAGVESMSDILKLSGRLEAFEFIPKIGNIEELGRYIVETYYDNEELKELKDFLDYPGLGRRHVIDHHGRFLRTGFVSQEKGTTLEELLEGAETEHAESVCSPADMVQ